MADKLERKSLDELVQELLREECDINELNVFKEKQREALMEALKKRPALLAKVKAENAQHLLKYVLAKDPLLFIHLTRSQYTDAFAQMFLYGRLTADPHVGKRKAETKNELNMIVQKSFDDKVVLAFAYATPDGEELCYFDKEWQVPLAIKTSAKISLKIVDAIGLIEKLDTHVTQLGEAKIRDTMFDLVSSQFTAYLTEYVARKSEGYYALCSAIRDVEEGFVNATRKAFAAYGVEIGEFIIKQFAIPKDVQNKIESLAFDIRQRREDALADAEFARVSLENYEAKLAIESKYPGVETSLTEYEKDLALKRYMIRLGLSEKKDVDLSVAVKQTKVAEDDALEKPVDILPEIKPKKNEFRAVFILLAALCGFSSVITMVSNLSVGLILAGAFVGLFGMVAAFCTENLKTQKAEPDSFSLNDEPGNPIE